MNRTGHKDSLWILAALVGILVNCIPALVSFKLDLPIFMDTAGTIAVSVAGGFFPGILVAVVTNIVCNIFNHDAIYFSSVNALIAIFSVWFARKASIKKIRNAILYIVSIGLISGICASFIQWGLLSGAQNDSVKVMVGMLERQTGIPNGVAFFVITILLNMIDKALCFGLAFLILKLIPEKVHIVLCEAAWRQAPLTEEDMKSMDKRSAGSGHSVKARISFVLVGTSIVLALIMTWVGVRVYFDHTKAERIEAAKNAAKFAASVIDPTKVSNYLAMGESAPGYKETEDMLYQIRDNAVGVEYLYIVKVDPEYTTFIFDLDAREGYDGYAYYDDSEGYDPGTVLPIEDAFLPYMDTLLSGRMIGPVESDSLWNHVVTVYYPVRDEKGNTVCFAGADASIASISEYLKDFVFRITLIMAGIIILIIAFGIWAAGIFIIYPINSITKSVENFIGSGSDQNRLDYAVKQMRKIDVRTNDEIERQYHAICDMALNQAEQLRNIRRFADSTSKMQDGLIITMADLVESRDSDTGDHVQKTAAYVKIIVEGLKKKGYYSEKLTEKFMSDVVRSAPLHDVGKINVSDKVLNKPGRLTDEEFAIIKTHTTAGRKIMEKAINTVGGENYLKEARNMAAYHHERWDGKGYPEGLHGEVIPLAARIMAVADVFDALTSPRVYKPAFPLDEALKMIQEGSGTQFDPKCVEVFMESLPEVKAVLRKYNQNVQME